MSVLYVRLQMFLLFDDECMCICKHVHAFECMYVCMYVAYIDRYMGIVNINGNVNVCVCVNLCVCV